MIKFSTLALAGAAVLGLTAGATAGVQSAGSLLVFPYYEGGRNAAAGLDTYVTVTNINLSPDTGTVKVEYVYINGQTCLEFNRTRTLTPGDTLTVNTRTDNPNSTSGYLYVFAKNKTTGAATSFNHLIGTSRVVNGGSNSDMEIAPFVFKASGAEGANTDTDNDGLRDMNGTEYEGAPDQLFMPRFVGQHSDAQSQLILIGLTGTKFTTTVDLLIWNDNEEVFSGQHTVDCWQKTPLSQISGAFDDSFLSSTNHNTLESFDGAESGMFWINGLIANSTAASVNGPAVLATLIEKIENRSGAVLPFGVGTQNNGDLVNQSLFADNN